MIGQDARSYPYFSSPSFYQFFLKQVLNYRGYPGHIGRGEDVVIALSLVVQFLFRLKYHLVFTLAEFLPDGLDGVADVNFAVFHNNDAVADVLDMEEVMGTHHDCLTEVVQLL